MPTPQIALSQGETVLLVEDEPMVLAAVRKMVERSGYVVEEAANGDAAVALLASERGANIAVVLSDVVMPGLRGRAFAERVQQLRPGLPIVFMSGYPDTDMHQGAGVPGVGILLRKPLSTAALSLALRQALTAGRSAAGPRPANAS